MTTLPTTRTAAAELTRDQINYMRTALPSVSITFVEREVPDAVTLARHYMKRRDDYLHFAPVMGEGYVFDPKRYDKAVNAFEALMEHIPSKHVPADWAERKAALT